MKRGILFVIAAFSLWAAFANVAFAGFGITPPYVNNTTLRPGSEFTQEIIIVRSDPVENLIAELTLNTPGIESWFSFDKGQKFTLPKGESQVRLNVTVRVPDTAKLGAYNGNIRLRTLSENVPTTGVSLALGAQIDVRLKVVEEIFDFQIRRAEMFEAEQGVAKWWLDFPGKIKFAMQLENTGNIPAAPARVDMRIYDPSGAQLLETTVNTNKLETTLPFATKRVVAQLPTWLPPGGYRVKYAIYKDIEDIAQQGELTLSILPSGTIPGYEGYGLEGLSRGDQLSLAIPAALLLFLILWFGLFRLRRRRRAPRRERVYRDEREDDDDRYDPPPRVVTRPRSTAGGVVDLSRRR